jgi:hypothetical protein
MCVCNARMMSGDDRPEVVAVVRRAGGAHEPVQVDDVGRRRRPRPWRRPRHHPPLLVTPVALHSHVSATPVIQDTVNSTLRYTLAVGQVRVCNVQNMLDRVNRRDRFSTKKPLRSSARGASFHSKHASNANVDRVVLLDANTYLALCSRDGLDG